MGIPSAALVTAICLGTATQSTPVELHNAFPVAEGVTIFLPKGWRQIPEEVMDTLNERLSMDMSEGRPRKIDQAFQKWPAAAWFRGPLILVRVDRSGRIPDLLKYREFIHESMAKAARAEQDAGRLLWGPQFEERPDESSGPAVWTRTGLRIAGVPAVELTKVKLTGFGAVHFTCCFAEAEALQYTPLFESILKSVAISEEIGYEPIAAPVTRASKWGRAAIGWGCIAFFAILTIIATRRRMHRTMRVLGVVFISMAWLSILGAILSISRTSDRSHPAQPEDIGERMVQFALGVFWVLILFATGRYLRREGRAREQLEPPASAQTRLFQE
jgi:hypothetical protein